jgi:hypothetical protein
MFTGLVRRDFPQTVLHTLETLLNLYRSHSYYITATPESRQALEDDIRQFIEIRWPSTDGRSEFALPYMTRAYRSVRRGCDTKILEENHADHRS